jgi:hypothetical protein
MLTQYYVPWLPRVAGRSRSSSYPLIDEVRCGGRLGYLRAPVPLDLCEASRHLERELVVASREELDAATQLLRGRAGGTGWARWARGARLDGAPRLSEVLARGLQVLIPLVGWHRLHRGW